MSPKLLIATILLLGLRSAHAAEDFVIRLNVRAPPYVISRAERAIQDISSETGSGEVGTRSRRGYLTANLSSAGLAKVRQLPGVAHVMAARDLDKLLPGRAPVRNPLATVDVARALIELGQPAPATPSCPVLLNAIERFGGERLQFDQALTMTFRDEDGVEHVAEYRFERLRLTDGKFKLRLRDIQGPVQLVGTLDGIQKVGRIVEVTLHVHRRSGSASALRLGRDLRVRFTL